MSAKVASDHQPANNLFKSLSTYLNQSQDSAAAHAKLIAKCQLLFKDANFDDFFDTFTSIMQHVMITMQKNSHIDRIIEFIAKFATSLSTKSGNMDTTLVNGAGETNKENQNQSTLNGGKSTMHDASSLTMLDQSGELGNPFLNSLIDYLIETNRSNSDAVRYRCCQMLSKLMASINDQFVDEDLFDRMCDAMLERLKDINSRVQVQAIAAIYRLQDPNDRDCRVIKALLFLMTYDPNWQVRYQALSHVAFSRATMPDIIDRVRDPHPTVRRKALLILSEKVLIKFISIEKRLFILNYALKDDDRLVTETCCKKLLPSWLAFKENDLCKLLKALDVVDSTDTIELMLNKMYADESLDRLFGDFSILLNDKHVIPSEKLDAESAFYWSWMCSKCKSIASSKDTNNTAAQVDSDDFLDRLLPSLTEFCEYVTEILRKFEVERVEKANDPRHQVENSFIVKQLIKLFAYIDYSDVHGKKMVINLCHELFTNKNYTFLFENVMTVYKMILPNLQQRINNLAELISDLKDPAPPTATQAEKEMEANNEPTMIDTTIVQPESNEKKLTASEINLKISELKFKRFKLKDDFDNLYKEARNIDKQVDMNKLSDLRAEIKLCEDEIADLQAQLNAPKTSESPRRSHISKSVHESTVTDASSANLQQQQQQQPFDPVESAFHCLQITVCLLQDLDVRTLTPQLRSLFDTLIIPNIGSVHEDIRKLAVRALNLTCILKLELAQKYVPLLLEIIQRDKKDVVIEAFKAMINCIMAFSTNRLINGCTDANNEIDPELVAEATSKILSVMTSLLDHEDSDIYTVAVEGFCKLYMTGHILSAKLFSKLLIMYYSPLTQNDVRLRACLSSFLPQFSFLRAANQLCVEEAFMPTLKCLLNASSDSYISEIDLVKVIEILYHLTNPKNLIQRKTVFNQVQQTANICHENIVKSICYEMLKDDNAYKCKTYLKVLQMADLSSADYGSLKEILELANDINEHIGDKILKKTSTKFYETILEQISKMPEYIQEQEEKRRELEETKTSDISRVFSVLGRTRSNVEEEVQNDTLSTSSNELIDLEFKKLNKKAGLLKKMSTTVTNMSTMPKTVERPTQRAEQPSTNGTIIPGTPEESERDEESEEEEKTVIEQENTSRVTRNAANKSKVIEQSSSESSDENVVSPKRKQQKLSDSPRKGRSISAAVQPSAGAALIKQSKEKQLEQQAKNKQARSQSSIVDSRKEVDNDQTEKRNKKRASEKLQPEEETSQMTTRRSSSRLNVSTAAAAKGSGGAEKTNEDEPPNKMPRPTKVPASKPTESSTRATRAAKASPPKQAAAALLKSRSLSKNKAPVQEKAAPSARSASSRQSAAAPTSARSSSRTGTLRKSPGKSK